ncbi:MAG TPA: hypothetical protein VK446_05155 [Methylocystis sp.]|nr:hypothetical protein [Methylocystis sp.]
MDRIELVTLNQPVERRPALEALRGWTRSFLMSDHSELGRSGNVCPFTSFGARLDTLRFGVSGCGADDAARMRRELLDAFAQFDEIPHPKNGGVYRAILIAFPNCASREGVAAMSQVQKSLRLTSFLRARMIGVFYPDAPEEGLWNKKFRPLRAPVPLIAIRSLVAQDAAFVLRHPLLAPAYLLNFPLAGPRELAALRLRKA